MRAFGAVLAFLGGTAILAGLIFILLSLPNLNDLHIWMGLGVVLVAFGAVVATVGWSMWTLSSDRGKGG